MGHSKSNKDCPKVMGPDYFAANPGQQTNEKVQKTLADSVSKGGSEVITHSGLPSRQTTSESNTSQICYLRLLVTLVGFIACLYAYENDAHAESLCMLKPFPSVTSMCFTFMCYLYTPAINKPQLSLSIVPFE